MAKKFNRLPKDRLLKQKPELYYEWDFEKNINIDIKSISAGSHLKVGWKCKLNHRWDATVTSRAKMNTGCPYCSNIKVWIGFNDMWTTNPSLASKLLNPDDGYKYTQNSNNKTHWKCNSCQEIVYDKLISNINRQGLRCPKCSDGISYPEKIVRSLLSHLSIDYEKEKIFDWKKDSRYDFYLPSMNVIIEVHGLQHFQNTTFVNSREQKKKDRQKRVVAEQNDKIYIEIDARKSNFVFIKNSLITNLSDILDLSCVNWESVAQDSLSSFKIKSAELWEKGFTFYEIADMLKLSYDSIRNYIYELHELGLCSKHRNRDNIFRISPCGIVQKRFLTLKETLEHNAIFKNKRHLLKVIESSSLFENTFWFRGTYDGLLKFMEQNNFEKLTWEEVYK